MGLAVDEGEADVDDRPVAVDAAFELGGEYLRWLERNGEAGLDAIARSCDLIATTAKALQFKTARVVNANRPFDPRPMLVTMAAAWDQVTTRLSQRYSTSVHQQ